MGQTNYENVVNQLEFPPPQRTISLAPIQIFGVTSLPPIISVLMLALGPVLLFVRGNFKNLNSLKSNSSNKVLIFLSCFCLYIQMAAFMRIGKGTLYRN